ncbi:MAG TPA: diacylglycerol kinase family protein [Mollicutes bacterium]|jgi:diacylglycerol kinase|nr:diacylglycerol kinase family protein [Mollicutes bacterium]
MNLESRDKRKKLGINRFINSFKYSFDGLAYAIKKEQSILVMAVFLLIVIAGGIFFNITFLEWFFVLIAIGLVLGTELLNTAIEATIDLTCPKLDPLAKIAKDTASASVFVYSVIAFIIGCLIFLPKVIKFIEGII